MHWQCSSSLLPSQALQCDLRHTHDLVARQSSASCVAGLWPLRCGPAPRPTGLCSISAHWLMLCALRAGRALRAARSRRGARAHTRPHVPLLRDLRQTQDQRPAGAPTAHCSLLIVLIARSLTLVFSYTVKRANHLAISFTLHGISKNTTASCDLCSALHSCIARRLLCYFSLAMRDATRNVSLRSLRRFILDVGFSLRRCMTSPDFSMLYARIREAQHSEVLTVPPAHGTRR